MTTGSKRWWRMVALTAVAGGVVGGWFGLAQPESAKADKNPSDETGWTGVSAPAPLPPTVSEAPPAPDAAPQTGPVVPASATLPIPVAPDGGPVVPGVPASPPILVPAAPLPVPPPGLPQIEPVAGPRVPDAGLVGDRTALPSIPAPPAPPTLAPSEPPLMPAPPKPPAPALAPVTPAGTLPAAPVAPAMPAVPAMPAMPAPTPSVGITPMKPDTSGLTVPIVPPAMPVGQLAVPPAPNTVGSTPTPESGSKGENLSITIPPPLSNPPKDSKPVLAPLPEVKTPPAESGLSTSAYPVAVPPPMPNGSAVQTPSTVEPPMALPLPSPTPVPPVELGPKPAAAPMSPVAPAAPIVPQPVKTTPSPEPLKATDPVQPVPTAKPNSDLKPTNPPNTLNPTASPVAPAVPIVPRGDVPAAPVDRPKPQEPNFGTSDKFVFPIPVKPVAPAAPVSTPRDDTMFNFTTTAAFAVLGGALLAAEKATALPTVAPSALIPMPNALAKADDKTDLKNLKDDLIAANAKIADLEKQVKKLTDLLTGKREGGLLVDPNAPGTVEDVTRLKDKIAALEKELASLRTQTVQKPAVAAPEVKPKGIVKIINEYPVEITMMINDKAPTYRVAPNSTVEVEVPVGEFTYQLLQSGAPATRSVIKDKEVVKLRIK